MFGGEPVLDKAVKMQKWLIESSEPLLTSNRVQQTVGLTGGNAGRVFIHSGICSQRAAHHRTPNYPQVHVWSRALTIHDASSVSQSRDGRLSLCFGDGYNMIMTQINHYSI